MYILEISNTLAHLITNPFQNESCSNRFKTNCLKFLVELSNQIKRLPMDENRIIAKMNVLDKKLLKILAIHLYPLSHWLFSFRMLLLIFSLMSKMINGELFMHLQKT